MTPELPGYGTLGHVLHEESFLADVLFRWTQQCDAPVSLQLPDFQTSAYMKPQQGLLMQNERIRTE